MEGIRRLANWTQLQPGEAGVGAVLELRETLGAGKKDHGGDVGSPCPFSHRLEERPAETASTLMVRACACVCMCVCV